MSENIRRMSHKKGFENSVFKAVTTKQHQTNDAPSLNELAQLSGTPLSVLKGTTSFYDFIEQDDATKETLVCHGTACLLNGSSDTAKAQCKNSGKAMCLGYCYQGAGVLQKENNKLQSGSLQQQVFSQPEMPVYNVSDSKILTQSVDDIASLYHVAQQASENILAELETSQLRGRGGAGFGFAFKCRASAQIQDDEKYIVCNADEGDPGAFSDRYLLEQHPHKVMAGMYAAAQATGAKTGVLYIRYEYPESILAVQQAIEAFKQLPATINTDFNFYIVKGAGSYVCGEETALLNSIEGLRPEVRVRPPYPASYGLWGKPTVVSNVETFANVPWILQNGGEKYAQIGTPESKGTKLISLDSQFVRAGLYEVDFGTPFDHFIMQQAGGFRDNVKALQVGGPLGSIIPVDYFNQLTIDFESFQSQSFALGHAGIIAIPQTYPMIDFMLHIFDYMAEESCGKCAPCRLGTAKGAQMIKQSKDNHPINKQAFNGLLELLETGSLCALGGGLPLPIRNMLDYFPDELSGYFTRGENA